MKRKGLKTEFLIALNRAIRSNLSGTRACNHCVEDAELIMAELNKRKEVTIKLVPDFNCSGYLTSFHVNFVGDRDKQNPHG